MWKTTKRCLDKIQLRRNKMQRCKYCGKIIWFFQYYIFGDLDYIEEDFFVGEEFTGLGISIYHLNCFLIEESENYGKRKKDWK